MHKKVTFQDIHKMSIKELEQYLETAQFGDRGREMALEEYSRKKFKQISEPHWTVKPNFWLTLIAALSGIVGCFLTWNSARQSKNPPANVVQQSVVSKVPLTQKKTEPRQNILKPISSSSASRVQGLQH